MHLGDIFHRKLFQKYKMHFGVLLNKTISEWQGQNFPCYNKMNRNEARTVADQIVPRDFRTTGRKAISLVLWTLSDSAILVLYLKVRVYHGLLDASSTPQCLHVVGSLPSHQNIYDAAALCCKDCRHFWLHVLEIALNLRNLSLGCEDCPQSWGPNVMY